MRSSCRPSRTSSAAGSESSLPTPDAVDPQRLRGLGPFTDLDEAGRGRVAADLCLRHLPAGTRLLEEDGPVGGIAVVATGELAVTRRYDGHERELARLGRGAVVGELALLDPHATASATVTATRDSELVVPRTGQGQALLDDPVVGPPIRAVAERRRATNRVATLGPVRATMADGTPVDLRPMWPDDWVLMEGGRDRTSRESLHQRFFSVPKLTETTLRRLATVDFVTDFAWVALDTSGTPAPDDDLLGVGRYARFHDEPDVAEVALIVTDAMQGRGLGARLVAALAVAAQEHGVRTFEAVALSGNRPIRRLLSRTGADWHTDPADPGLVTTRWPVAEAVARSEGVADLDALRGLVRRALGEAP